MKILHYMQSIDFRNGGPPRAVIDQVATMFARGHHASLATTVNRDVPQSWRGQHDDACPVLIDLPTVRGPLGRFDRNSIDQIASVVSGFDVVHLHGVWEPSNLQVAAVCRTVGVPYAVSLRGMLDDWSMNQSGLRKRIYLFLGGRRYLESAAAVHCTAQAELEQSRKWFPRGNGVVVPNLIDLEPFTSIPEPDTALQQWPSMGGRVFNVLFLSRIQYKKGLEHLVDAVSILRGREHTVRVMVAGTGDKVYIDAIRQRAERVGVDDCFEWLGHVGGDLKLSLFAAADVFALPTSQENFGFVFFESLAAGTPVITTDLVDTCGEIEESGGGVIVGQTGDQFADAIESFITGIRDARTMGRSGREWVLENLSTDVVARRFEVVYESMLD